MEAVRVEKQGGPLNTVRFPLGSSSGTLADLSEQDLLNGSPRAGALCDLISSDDWYGIVPFRLGTCIAHKSLWFITPKANSRPVRAQQQPRQ
jgi:hypothetical protein